jgi:2-dehydro-3-deoxyglucarate aldolase/4-hydroxy-2-oxoheptanedioate aldolase
MKLTFRKELLSGKKMIGTLVSLPCPSVTEILCDAGFDWLFIDGEHSPLAMGDIQNMLQAAGDRCSCVVRIPANDEVFIKQVLDVGASGLIAPHVNTAEIAEQVVRFAKYPPIGERSVGVARANGYGFQFAEYVKNANDQLAVVVQIEHVEAARNIESILEVDGVDAVFIGPYDLSASMGKPGKIQDPEVQDYMNQVREASRQRKKPIGIFAISVDDARPYLDQGYALIAVGVDTMMLGQAARDIVKKMRSSE